MLLSFENENDRTSHSTYYLTKVYVPVVTLWTQDNAKLLQQLKSGFERTVNWNKYQLNPKTYAQNRYLNHLVDPSFQRVNRLFVIIFWKWKW